MSTERLLADMVDVLNDRGNACREDLLVYHALRPLYTHPKINVRVMGTKGGSLYGAYVIYLDKYMHMYTNRLS